VIHAQALVATHDPSALAAGLAARLRHEFATEWAAEAGSVKLNEGTLQMFSWPEGLRLDARAETGAELSRIESFIAEQIEQNAENGVSVVWRRRPLSEIPR
jgi:hypothetical protein